MVTLQDAQHAMSLVQDLMTDPEREGWHLQSAFADQPQRRNKILATAWDRLPWNHDRR